MYASSHTDSRDVKRAVPEAEGAAPEAEGAAPKAKWTAPGAEGAPAQQGAPAEKGAPAAAEGAPAQPPRPRTKAAQREATTAALIEAARKLFAERGYAGVGTEEIVKRAGVTRGALYHHFPGGKEDLFRAVLVQLSAETLQRVVREATRTDDPWEELVLGAEAFLDACAVPEVQRIMLIDGPAVLGWEVWRAIDADYGIGILAKAVKQAMDAGRMVSGSAIAVAHVLSGALDEAAMVVARADDPAAARAEMSRTLRRLLEGLRGPVA